MTVEVTKMDDLNFRRTIYAEPNCDSEEVKSAAAEDPSKQEFWDEIRQLDSAITQASKVAVPEDLAHRLILRQSIESHKANKKRGRVHLALAASVIFTFGLSFGIWQQQSTQYIGEHALAHIYEEGNGYAMKASADISIEKVNTQLASLGAQFTQSLGKILYANFCNFDNVRSYHMVMEDTDGSKYVVFVVPHSDKLKLEEEFSDDKMTGQTFNTSHASVVVVGDKGKSVEEVKYKLKQNMLFSA
ncbi:MAG: DUF3379 domain-containing protein [Aliiglaciecola sp.]